MMLLVCVESNEMQLIIRLKNDAGTIRSIMHMRPMTLYYCTPRWWHKFSIRKSHGKVMQMCNDSSSGISNIGRGEQGKGYTFWRTLISM